MVLSSFAPVLVNNLPREVAFANNNMTITEVSPIVVMFGYSQEELAAKIQILDNFPNSIIIDFSDVEMIYQNSNPIIYIGHSSKEGIAYNTKIIEWDKIAYIIENSISNDHFIQGCDSETITSLTASTGKNVVSFNQEIDAIAGALIVTISIAGKLKLDPEIVFYFLRKALTRMIEITLNPEISLPLRLGGEETYTIGLIGLVIAASLYPCTSAVVAISIGVMISGLLVIAYALYGLVNIIIDLINGKSVNFSSAVNYLWTLITTLTSVYAAAISALAWWRAGAAITCFSADTASNAVATVAKVLLLSTALAVIMSSMILFVYDYVDWDLTFW